MLNETGFQSLKIASEGGCDPGSALSLQCYLLILLEFNKHCLTCHVAQRSVRPPAHPFPVELLQAKTGSPLVLPTRAGEVDSIRDEAK